MSGDSPPSGSIRSSPDLSYFGHNLNTTRRREAGIYIWTLDTCSYWRIAVRIYAYRVDRNRSHPPLGYVLYTYTSAVHTQPVTLYQQLHQPSLQSCQVNYAARGMSLLETSSFNCSLLQMPNSDALHRKSYILIRPHGLRKRHQKI